jgi:hypothetical protein
MMAFLLEPRESRNSATRFEPATLAPKAKQLPLSAPCELLSTASEVCLKCAYSARRWIVSLSNMADFIGRGDWIRTSDPLRPR